MKAMKVRPNAVEPSPAEQRRQRERYVESGGLLQGFSPERVLRLGYYAGALCVLCVLIIVELLLGPVAPRNTYVRAVAAVAWVIPIAILAALLAPGVRLAWLDRKAQPRVIQGQLLGASTVSPTRGLGMIMVRTRQGSEQYMVEPEKLSRVPGNVVNVVLSVTPRLHYVRSVQVIGQRQVGRPEPPVPPVLRRIQLMPFLTPGGIAVGAILGDDVPAFIPMHPEWAHAIVAFVIGAALAGGVFGALYWYQRRLMKEAQALVPGGLA